MGIIELLVEMKKEEFLEEGRQEGAEETTRRFIENLLKGSDLPLEKIASLTDVSLEAVKEINIIYIMEQLAEAKSKEIWKECRARGYSDDFSFRHVRDYLKSYKVGLHDGVELVIQRFVEGLLKRSGHSPEEIAALADVSVETVRKIKGELRQD